MEIPQVIVLLSFLGAALLGFVLWRKVERRRIQELIPLLEEALGSPILLVGSGEQVLALGDRAREFLLVPEELPQDGLDGLPIPGLRAWFQRARLNPSGEGVVS